MTAATSQSRPHPYGRGAPTATSFLNTARCRRGLALFRARARQIWRVAHESYRVPSQTGSGIYRVSLEPGAEHCTCPDYARHGHHNEREPAAFFCKHLYAALLWRIKHELATATTTSTVAPSNELEVAS